MKLPLSGVVILLAACTAEVKDPGDERMGNFEFTVRPLEISCPFDEADAGVVGFTGFTGRFSRNHDGSAAWLTLGVISRPATFDGQVIDSTVSAVRRFTSPRQPDGGLVPLSDGGICLCGQKTQLVETLRVALLSTSQFAAAQGSCPPNPLDGGVPAPDGGVLAPGTTDAGFDALAACGELTDLMVPGDDAQCPECAGCRMRYQVDGIRR